jgi:hypothetical protein
MQPGEIYKMDFAFEPPQQGSEYRPALIMQVDHARSIAVAIKITRSAPTREFPYRERIMRQKYANLDYTSYAQYDWFNIIPIRPYKKIGSLHPTDFARISTCFQNYHLR